ncbi:MAG: glucose-1-phosphate cytidylyltransferase [Elusimicrobia bacterium]|nr:glucose-1-phosphate cytidylyltransferase [Elusimicrobiota bacterium]
MKAVILAGGLGSRLSEETDTKPKPMVEIGSFPILWHVMKIYSAHGINDFLICLGYKGYVIKEYFANYFLHMSDVTMDLKSNKVEVHRNSAEPWRVTLVDTGLDTMTGGRLKRIRSYVEGETFCFTYGDGLGDVDIRALIGFHKKTGLPATVTAVRAPGRFGSISLDGNKAAFFAEKPLGDGAWINGGFFVLEPGALDTIQGDATLWEKEPMERLAKESKLAVYRHEGFWHPMDTLRDKRYLDELWASRKAPWKTWD